MIGKCKAIAHGSTALDYIFREGKLGSRLAFHNLCSRDPKTIYEEMKVVSNYNSRCRNKFPYRNWHRTAGREKAVCVRIYVDSTFVCQANGT